MSDQPKLVWRSKRVLPQEQRYRNTLFPRDHQRYVGGGIRWWLVITAVVLLGGVGTALWSPLLAITTVTISGNTFVDAATIQTAANHYLDGRTLGIFPRRSFLVASEKGMTSSIQKALRGNPAVTAVRTQKTFPLLVAIAVTEQIPTVIYSNNGTKYYLNRSGSVTGLVPDGTKVSKRFPQLYDQTSHPVSPGTTVVKPSTLDALFTAQDLLTRDTAVVPDFYYLPPVVCPKADVQDGGGDQGSGVVNAPNTNVHLTNNTNSATTNRANNTNTSTAKNALGTKSAKKGNGTGSVPNTNIVSSDPACNVALVVLKNPELYVRTVEKWDILMRSDQSIEDQVARLVRVLNETKPDRKKLHSIDLRFGENVIVR